MNQQEEIQKKKKSKLRSEYDVIIVGTGAAGLFCALALDSSLSILMVTKKGIKDCNSYLAQGGMCVLKEDADFDCFMEDTLKAGHYKNRKESVRTMIRRSRDILRELLTYGVDFDRQGRELSYTKEGGHRKRRIVHCKDETGKAIVEGLVRQVKSRGNIQVMEETEMVDLIIEEQTCQGVYLHFNEDSFTQENIHPVYGRVTVLATGGIGGLYENSTNFRHITGDALGILRNYQAEMEHLDYIQIHPTTLFHREKDGRKRLLTEALRGEGAHLLNHQGQRFTDELKPRDLVSAAIFAEMKREKTDHVYLSLRHLDSKVVKTRFPYIYAMCKDRGLDLCQDLIPIVPGQHYHMGGIHVNQKSRSSIQGLYAIGECSCNGVHGKNRLASNSLLESMVFAQVVAEDIKLGEGLINPRSKNLPKVRDWQEFLAANHAGLRERIEANNL